MRWLFVFIFLSWACISYSQLPAEIKFINYTRADDLPEENVNNIAQDSRGFLWLGTREGLIRFDGLHFKTWYADPNDSLKFPNNNIRVVRENNQQQLVFLSGTELWQINIFNHQLRRINRFRNKQIPALPQKVNKNTWLLIDTDSVYLTGDNFEAFYRFSIIEHFGAGTQVSAFPLHWPWCLLNASPNNRAAFFNYETKAIIPVYFDDTPIDSRAKMLVPQVYDSSNQRLYLSTYFNGNFYCDLQVAGRTSYQLIPFAAQKNGAVRKSIQTGPNRMVQVGDNGISITDFKSYISFNDKSAIDNPPVSRILVDIYHSRENDFWLSGPNGISRFNMNASFAGYIKINPDITATDELKSIVKGSDGNIYILSTDRGLFRFDKQSKTIKLLDNGTTHGWSATRSGDDIIATGGPKKIMVYNIRNSRITSPDFLQPFFTKNTDLITLVYKAGNGDLWYSCNGSAGIIRNPANSNRLIQYSRMLSPPSFSHSYVHAAAEDSHGNIWWCTNKNSNLLKWDNALQQFTEHPIDKLIPQFTNKTGINNIYIDAVDNLWIALDAAAMIKYNINTGKGNYYDINKGLPTDVIAGMTSDAKNRLWFGTRKGLCCYLPDRDKVVTFTSYDGLPEDDFSSNGFFYDKEDNLVYAGARNTIAYFNPDTLLSKTITAQPPVFIEEMRVNGKAWYFENDKKNLLSPDENNIEFSFAAPDFNRNNQLEFQYLLKGAGNDWVNIGDNRKVTFNNLTHGSYTLIVRCKYKGNEGWTETATPLSFTIKTPLVKTLWFRLLMVAVAVLLAWLIIRNYYRRKLEKQQAAAERVQAVEKERTRIATDMHDDFGANLSRIKFISEKMQLTQSANEGLKKDLTKISDYSDEMAEKMNEIVWALNQRYDSCADLVSFCRAYASEFLQDKNIRLNFSTDDIPDKKVQGEVRRNTFLVMKEALHNVAKHAGATVTNISFRFTDKSMSLEIADNGRGFEAGSIRPFANGLENMKKRIADINGNININGEKGTHISLSVPI